MEELLNTRWFVYDYHCAAGRPKMEDAIFEFAREILLYKIVDSDDFDRIVTILNRKQQELYAQNKRLKEVDIKYSTYYMDGHRSLSIGEQSIRFRRIEGEFNAERI